jgi:hypothetical protein
LAEGNALVYELREDGILYDLAHGVKVKVQARGRSRVRVSMQHGSVLIPPETGDLGSSTFRAKLVDLASERFGDANGLVEELGLIAIAFEAHLAERERAAEKYEEKTTPPELVGTSYRLADGVVVRLKNTREGEIPQRLTNFVARVEEEIVRDDGAETRRLYKVIGEAGGKALPPAEVPAASFGTMNWVSDTWGLTARITAGQGIKDHAREAVELLYAGAPVRRMYAHTGWRELPGYGRAYLHAGGAIGAEGVEVELEPGLERYILPSPDKGKDLLGAVRASIAFLRVAPARVTAPLLAAAYLAPLSEVVVPRLRDLAVGTDRFLQEHARCPPPVALRRLLRGHAPALLREHRQRARTLALPPQGHARRRRRLAAGREPRRHLPDGQQGPEVVKGGRQPPGAGTDDLRHDPTTLLRLPRRDLGDRRVPA